MDVVYSSNSVKITTTETGIEYVNGSSVVWMNWEKLMEYFITNDAIRNDIKSLGDQVARFDGDR